MRRKYETVYVPYHPTQGYLWQHCSKTVEQCRYNASKSFTYGDIGDVFGWECRKMRCTPIAEKPTSPAPSRPGRKGQTQARG